MEGFVVTQIIGMTISEWAFEKPEVQEHQGKWEGNTSSESGWVDRGPTDMVVDQAPSPIRRHASPERHSQKDNQKSKTVISSSNLKVAANLESRTARSCRINLGPQQLQPVCADPELIEVTWNGNNMTVVCEQWLRFLQAQGVGGSALPAVAPSGLPSPAVAISSSGSPSRAMSSLVPPGFEHMAEGRKKRVVGKAKALRKTMAHKAFHRHLSASRSLASSTKHSKSSSSCSVALPINAKVDSMLATILSNCGVRDPIPSKGLERLRALESDRAKASS